MAVDLAAITMIEMPDLSKAAVFLEDHKLPEAIAEFRAHTGSFWFWNRARARYAARAKELTEIIKQYEERGNSGSVMNGLKSFVNKETANDAETDLKAWALLQEGIAYKDRRQPTAMMRKWDEALNLAKTPDLRAHLYSFRCAAKVARPALGDAQRECDSAMSIVRDHPNIDVNIRVQAILTNASFEYGKDHTFNAIDLLTQAELACRGVSACKQTEQIQAYRNIWV